MEWYRVGGIKGRLGTGQGLDNLLYVRAKDVCDALQRYKGIPGQKDIYVMLHPKANKKRRPKVKFRFTPTITLVTDKQVIAKLEKMVGKEIEFEGGKRRVSWWYRGSLTEEYKKITQTTKTPS